MCGGVKVTVVVGSIGGAIYLQAIFHGNGPLLTVDDCSAERENVYKGACWAVRGDSSLSSW